MTDWLNQIVPQPLEAIEIDKEIYNIEALLNTNLAWLEQGYGRAYRKIENDKGTIYYPEVYRGTVQGKPEYIRTTYNENIKSMCYFVVGKEEQMNFENQSYNYLKWNVGLIFLVNLDKINSALLDTEIFTQNLIREVRQLLTQALTKSTRYKLKSVEREYREIFREYTMSEFRNTMTAPHDCFRINFDIELQEECDAVVFNRCEAIERNISDEEKQNCILPFVDWSDPANLATLTTQQKTDLSNELC